MLKTMIVIGLVCVISSAAIGDDYHFITVESNNSGILTAIWGFPGYYWGQTPSAVFLSGDDTARLWLENRGVTFSAVTFDPDISILFLCYSDNINLAALSPIATGRDYVVSVTPLAGASAIRRLSPIALPRPGDGIAPPMIQTYNSNIDTLISRVDRDSIISYLTRLSGRAPIEIDDRMDTIHTRYSGTSDNKLAAQFLKETLANYGYQTEYQNFYTGDLRNVAAYGNRAWTVTELSEAIRTTDNGETWQVMPDNTSYRLWGVENVGGDSVWISGDIGTILFSRNGGINFVTQVSGQGVFLFGIDFTDNLNGWIVGDQGRVIHTTNGGQNWSTQTSPTDSRLYDICFVDTSFGWAVGRDGVILHTTDGGAHWGIQISNTIQRLYSVAFTDRNHGWSVGTAGTLLRTADGGANWGFDSLGVTISLYHVDFVNSQRGCIAGFEGEIFVTTDGGESWAHIDAGISHDFYGADFADSLNGYAVGNGALIKTTDGGVTWHNRTAGIESGWQNIIATKIGGVSPNRQVIICGHYDDTSQQPLYDAPGADDNGSGAGGVIEAARIFADVPFERTIKFCLWTGEEQGLLGSAAYAADAQSAGDTILGVFNYDMIAWDGDGDGSIELHCGNMAASQNLGRLFEDVVSDYNIDLQPEFLTWSSTDRSDHASFWDHGYPAILGIEDYSDDFNPYYHTNNDDMDIIDTTMFFEFVKAAVGSAASLAIPDTDFTAIYDEVQIPSDFKLLQNYPNPFNPSTSISFNLPHDGWARLDIFDLLGRSIRTLIDCPLSAGFHRVNWDGRIDGGVRASSGIYFARLSYNGMTSTIRMTLEK